MRDFKRDLKAAKKLHLSWWGLLCVMVTTLLVAWLFNQWGRLNLTLPVMNCVAVFSLIIYLKRQLSRRLWFWLLIAAIVALHVLLIIYIPWTTKWVPAATIAGINTIDFCAILMILEVVSFWLGSKES